MVISDEYGNWRIVNAAETNEKYFSIGDGDLYTISICSNMQPQLYKIATISNFILFCRVLVFGLASSSSN